MSFSELTKALLCRGYFPKELPPAFTTETFGLNIEEILKDWERDRIFKRSTTGKYKGRNYSYSFDAAEAEPFSAPKRGY
jgi:hypothetical protein